MEFIYLFKGFILGISVAAPVGPIGIICINRTINRGYISGVASGLGAATADLVYGLVAGLGLTIISNILIEYSVSIQVVGIIFLFYIGIKTILKKPSNNEVQAVQTNSIMNDYLTTFFLTITNPLTILFFIAVFAGLGLSGQVNNNMSTTYLVLGVFVGSGIWWLFLCGLTHRLKSRLGKKNLRQLNTISGVVILLFGLIVLRDLIVAL